MPQSRHFLGWDRPLCTTVSERLLTSIGGTFDLRDTAIVTPTRQSSWRLRLALPLAAQARGGALLGPEVMTAPALLRPPPKAGQASDLQLLLAWCSVLRAVPAGELEAFLGHGHASTMGWALPVARRLMTLREELADGALSIADVAARGSALAEADRWAAMAELERRDLALLAEWGLSDPVADQLASARAGRVDPGIRRVILAAMPDPPNLLVAQLAQWAAQGGMVEVWVAAPESEAAAFDAWGRPQPDAWAERPIALEDSDICLAADPEDQAVRIATWVDEGLSGGSSVGQSGRPTAQPSSFASLRDLRGGRSPAAYPAQPSLALGVPDREVVAPLARELSARQLPVFDPRNRSFSETPLCRLVEMLLAWRERAGYAETAALLRHPDVLAAVKDPVAALQALDGVQAERLPVMFEDLRRAAGDVAATPHGLTDVQVVALREALATLNAWRARLTQPALASGLRATLQEIYAARRLKPGLARDDLFREAAAALDGALRELAAAEAAGQTGAEAAAALLARLQRVSIKPARNREPLDLEGWLELAWNPSPVLCVAGMNEGFVPDGHVGDLFLPDALRRDLGLRDDARRVARDAYVLTQLTAQRRAGGRTLLLVGRTSLAGDPLRPSRLLFRCADEALVGRAQKLFQPPAATSRAAPFAVSFLLDPARVPADERPAWVAQRISATTFRDYLACPLRFYLKRVLHMAPADDLAREPDARAFGTLMHDAFEAMAREGIWGCGDADQLAGWLEARLRAQAVQNYGARPWLGVTLAVESAVRRLRAFAARQVAWHAAGWEIVEFESDRHAFDWHGVRVQGRIDRVDRNGRDGRVCVLDYKSTDRTTMPPQAHLAAAGDTTDLLPEALVPAGLAQTRKDRRWIDLQLPVYREMVRAAYGPDAQVGYVLLPATLGDTQFVLWEDYADALHAHAMACAGAVIDRLRANVFWPPAASPAYDDFESLLFDDARQFIVAPPAPGGPAGRGEVAP